MKEIEIEITQDDVSKARAEAKNTAFLSKCCPTHRALRRILNVSEFGVGSDWVFSGKRYGDAVLIGRFEINSPITKQIRNFNIKTNYEFDSGKYKILIEEKYLK